MSFTQILPEYVQASAEIDGYPVNFSFLGGEVTVSLFYKIETHQKKTP